MQPIWNDAGLRAFVNVNIMVMNMAKGSDPFDVIESLGGGTQGKTGQTRNAGTEADVRGGVRRTENAIRRMHGVAGLKQDPVLNKLAAETMDAMIRLYIHWTTNPNLVGEGMSDDGLRTFLTRMKSTRDTCLDLADA